MPRASWRGSLVSCPIFLSPATTRTKPIRLDQVATSGGRRGRGRFVGSGRRAEGFAGSVPRLLAEMAALMETRAPPPLGSRSGRTIPEPARRLRSARSSKATNTAAASSSTLTAEELKAVDVEIYSDYRGTRPERR
jgi:hypothetical protein